MSRQIRSRRAGLSPEESRARPLYARVLGLQYLNPSAVFCFMFFEGTIAFGVLLALAELIDWWGVLVLPAAVAVMVKINDVIAGASVRSANAKAPRPRTAAEARRRGAALRRKAVGRAAVPLVTEGLRPATPDEIAAAAAVTARESDYRVGRQRVDGADSEDVRTRQSASRRYE